MLLRFLLLAVAALRLVGASLAVAPLLFFLCSALGGALTLVVVLAVALFQTLPGPCFFQATLHFVRLLLRYALNFFEPALCVSAELLTF